MIKKISIIISFVAVSGLLIWGGVNRTLAKSESPTAYKAGYTNQEKYSENGGGRWGRGSEASEVAGSENQRLRAGQAEHEECGEESHKQGVGGNAFGDWNNTFGAEKNAFGGGEGGGYEGGRGNGSQGGELVGRGNGGRGNGRGGNGNGGGDVELSGGDIQALELALDDEYRALATYLAVMDSFGEVEPFASIAQSEERHIAALIRQYTKYGLPVPENTWLGQIPAFESLEEACQAGVDAEIANVELYEELFGMTQSPALINVFTNLSRASQESHLPEFEACR